MTVVLLFREAREPREPRKARRSPGVRRVPEDDPIEEYTVKNPTRRRMGRKAPVIAVLATVGIALGAWAGIASAAADPADPATPPVTSTSPPVTSTSATTPPVTSTSATTPPATSTSATTPTATPSTTPASTEFAPRVQESGRPPTALEIERRAPGSPAESKDRDPAEAATSAPEARR